MRAGTTAREALTVVRTVEPVHVVLDLEHTDGTISGQLSIAGDRPTSFHGWLELIDRLERAAEGRCMPPDDPAQPTGG